MTASAGRPGASGYLVQGSWEGARYDANGRGLGYSFEGDVGAEAGVHAGKTENGDLKFGAGYGGALGLGGKFGIEVTVPRKVTD
jgi:hypothetical protein